MPMYQFTVTEGSQSAKRKQEIATAITKAHCDVTGAPARYVNCTFNEVPDDGIYIAGEPVPGARMVGIIRRRPEALKRELLMALGHGWASATGEPIENVVMALVEIPGYQGLEDGVLLGEAEDDIHLQGV
jgi:phenylpyruvate tautomerase PptA (4-oxalocrotonate tautomerase family)